MAAIVVLKPGDVLVIRRADDTLPSVEEQERLIDLTADLGIAGVLVLGVSDPVPDVLRLSDEELDAIGLQRKAADQ